MDDLTFLDGSGGQKGQESSLSIKKKKWMHTQQVSTLKLKTEDKCPIIWCVMQSEI